jgi:RNA polymerase sigma factor (sigma-70 family)
MTSDQISELRKEFLKGDSLLLAKIFKDHGQYCIDMLVKKRNCPIQDAEDIFVEAILNLREKIIDRKLQELSNLRSYLWGTCQNMHKQLIGQEIRVRKKKEEMRLLFDKKSDLYLDDTFQEKLKKVAKLSFLGLNEKCQELLRMFYVLRLPMIEIAEEFGFASADVAKTTKKRCYDRWLKEARILLEETKKNEID